MTKTQPAERKRRFSTTAVVGPTADAPIPGPGAQGDPNTPAPQPVPVVVDQTGQEVPTGESVSLAIAITDLTEPAEGVDVEGDLTPAQVEKLALCHRAFDNYAEAQVFAIIAMHTVREERLYRKTHKTFEEFVEEVWDAQKTWVDRQIGRLRVTKALDIDPIGSSLLSESQARELTGLLDKKGPDAVKEVWEEASAGGGKLTAQALREVRERRYPRSATPQKGRAPVAREIKLVRQLGTTPPEIAATLRAGLDDAVVKELVSLLSDEQ